MISFDSPRIDVCAGGPLLTVNSVDARLDGDPGVVHVAAHMGEDLSLEAELADSLTILARLLRSSGRSELDLAGGCKQAV